MKQYVDIEYRELEQEKVDEKLINDVIAACFVAEHMENSNLYVSVILTTPHVIQQINRQYRNIDKETDVLSFPMFEKEEISFVTEEEALGDIVISVEKVRQQAKEYGHRFERELAYMLVHGFYHLMGEDHIEEEDKLRMREKEENVLNSLNITR